MDPKKPVYEQVLVEHLRITPAHLEEIANIICDKLGVAAAELGRENGYIFGINQCLHLASSIVLQRTSDLNHTLDWVRWNLGETFRQGDPTIAVTIATLYYILRDEPERDPFPSPDVKRTIRRHFDKINWLIGKDGMNALGLTADPEAEASCTADRN